MLKKMIRKYLQWKGEIYKESEYIDTSVQELEKLTEELNKKDRELYENYQLLTAENKILKKAAQNEPINTVFKYIVDTIEYICSDSIASILINYGGHLYEYLSPGLPEELRDKLRAGIEIDTNSGVFGKAAHYRTYINSCTEKDWENIPDFYHQIMDLGYVCHASEPIIGSENDVLGTITVYFIDDNRSLKDILCWSAKIAAIVIERDKENCLLYTNAERLRGILESQTDIIFRIKKDGTFTFANRAFLNTFNVGSDIINNDKLNINDLIYKKDINYFNNKMNTLYNYTDRVHVEQRFLTNIGYRWFELEGTFLYNKDNEPNEIQLSGRDITERKQKEHDYELLLNNVENLIWYMKDESTIGKVNKSFIEFFGDNEIEGSNLWDILPEEQADKLHQSIKSVFEEQVTKYITHYFRDKDGNDRFMSIAINPKINGTAHYVVCSASKILSDDWVKELKKIRLQNYRNGVYQ